MKKGDVIEGVIEEYSFPNKGSFYHNEDKNGGHPVMVYEKRIKEDTYSIQKFSSKRRKGREKLLHNIDPNNDKKETWLIRKPKAVGYDDIKYLDKYKDYRVHPDDIETVKKYQKKWSKKEK